MLVGSSVIVVTQELVRELAFLVAVIEDVGPQRNLQVRACFSSIFFTVEFAPLKAGESRKKKEIGEDRVRRLRKFVKSLCACVC
jgi:hypothetical protein